ncbi:MAG: hypothetical protein IKZ55_05950 [Bacteroidales bacterium]|nr:hypothetical protein [Bacteroidales bacterium]
MKRLLICMVITSMISVLCSCSTSHTKAFRTMQQEMTDLEKTINATEDCDDLQMLSFSILGLRSDLTNLVQDDASLKESEADELMQMIERTEQLWMGRRQTLGCSQTEIEGDELDTSGEEDGYNGGNSN